MRGSLGHSRPRPSAVATQRNFRRAAETSSNGIPFGSERTRRSLLAGIALTLPMGASLELASVVSGPPDMKKSNEHNNSVSEPPGTDRGDPNAVVLHIFHKYNNPLEEIKGSVAPPTLTEVLPRRHPHSGGGGMPLHLTPLKYKGFLLSPEWVCGSL